LVLESSLVNCTWVGVTSVSGHCIDSSVDCHVVWMVNYENWCKKLCKGTITAERCMVCSSHHVSLIQTWKLSHFESLLAHILPVVLLLFRQFTLCHLMAVVVEDCEQVALKKVCWIYHEWYMDWFINTYAVCCVMCVKGLISFADKGIYFKGSLMQWIGFIKWHKLCFTVNVSV
jgi:hypothetical protein